MDTPVDLDAPPPEPVLDSRAYVGDRIRYSSENRTDILRRLYRMRNLLAFVLRLRA